MSFRARPALLKLAGVAACALGTSLGAHAALLKENFNAAFPAWESRWFGQHSNATNYCTVWYCLVDGVPTAPSNTVRGIAGSGLILSSTQDFGSAPITVTFDAEFGASIRAMSIDVAVYVDSTFSALDASGSVVYSRVLRVDDYRDVPTSHYQTLRFRAPAGIASFSMSGPADGNTVIDNIAVKTSQP